MYQKWVGSQFKTDLKSYIHLPHIIDRIDIAIDLLSQGHILAPEFRDHPLKWAFTGIRECHISPDILLMYEIDKKKWIIYLVRIGSHSELFG